MLVLLLIVQVTTFQKDDGLEDYGPEPLADDPKSPGGPKDGKADGPQSELGPEGDKGLETIEEDQAKTKFSDDRFAKLFPSRGNSRTFQARNVAKPKPTLPSFIKSTPPYQKLQISTTPAPRGGLNRARSVSQATTRRSGSTTTIRPRRGNQPTQRQLSGRLSTAAPTNQRATPVSNLHSSAASTPSAAALAAARRLRQGNGISRFNRNNVNNQHDNNSTIPALNPRRN